MHFIQGANGTALHEASLFGKIEVVSLLLKRGINARTIDSSGRTALELVAQLDTQISREIAQLIIGEKFVLGLRSLLMIFMYRSSP